MSRREYDLEAFVSAAVKAYADADPLPRTTHVTGPPSVVTGRSEWAEVLPSGQLEISNDVNSCLRDLVTRPTRERRSDEWMRARTAVTGLLRAIESATVFSGHEADEVHEGAQAAARRPGLAVLDNGSTQMRTDAGLEAVLDKLPFEPNVRASLLRAPVADPTPAHTAGVRALVTQWTGSPAEANSLVEVITALPAQHKAAAIARHALNTSGFGHRLSPAEHDRVVSELGELVTTGFDVVGLDRPTSDLTAESAEKAAAGLSDNLRTHLALQRAAVERHEGVLAKLTGAGTNLAKAERDLAFALRTNVGDEVRTAGETLASTVETMTFTQRAAVTDLNKLDDVRTTADHRRLSMLTTRFGQLAERVADPDIKAEFTRLAGDYGGQRDGLIDRADARRAALATSGGGRNQRVAVAPAATTLDPARLEADGAARLQVVSAAAGTLYDREKPPVELLGRVDLEAAAGRKNIAELTRGESAGKASQTLRTATDGVAKPSHVAKPPRAPGAGPTVPSHRELRDQGVQDI